jgi:hypothetical protein
MGVTVKRSVVCLFVFVLLSAALLASSNSDDFPLKIKIIRAETLPLQAGSSTVAEGCNQGDYSASCMHSSDRYVQNMMVVESEDGKTFTIACTVESRWSNCIPLPVGESFRARIEKNGLSVLYLGSNGRQRMQQYRLLPNAPKTEPAATK